MPEGEFDLAPVLAEDRGDGGHAEEREDVLLTFERVNLAVRNVDQTVGFKPVALLERHPPEAGQKPAGAGGAEERGAAPGRLGEPDLQSGTIERERDHSGAPGGPGTAHDGVRIAGSDNHDPADGARPPPVTPRNRVPSVGKKRFCALEDGVGLWPGHPVRPPAELSDASLDRLFLLCAEAGERPYPVTLHRLLKVVERQDAEFLPEGVQGPGPHPADVEQFDERPGDGGLQFLEFRKRPGGGGLPDLPG